MIDKTNRYYEIIIKRITNVMKEKGLTQTQVAQKAQEMQYSLNQSTISKMLKSYSSMSIQNVVQIADVLGIDLNDLLAQGDSEEVRSYAREEKEIPSSLIRRADAPEMRPYLNSYYTYFIETQSTSDKIIEGKLRFDASPDQSRTVATLKFLTGRKDVNNDPISKEYVGELCLSPRMTVAYCTLVNEQIGEMSYIVFNYLPIIFESLKCRVAMVLTACSGANRLPTAHRMIISHRQLSHDEQEILKGQLRLNKSEILISESGLAQFFKDERLPASVTDYFRLDEKGPLFRGLSPLPYYFFDEAVFRSAFLKREDKELAINLIRQYSSSPKNTKVASKCDDFVYRFIEKENGAEADFD